MSGEDVPELVGILETEASVDSLGVVWIPHKVVT